MSVMCCQVEVSAPGWSLVQRSPTDCGASLRVIYKPREWGNLSPLVAYCTKRQNKTKRMQLNNTKGNSMLCVHGNIFDIPVFSLQNLFYQNNSTDGRIKEGKDPKATFLRHIHRNIAYLVRTRHILWYLLNKWLWLHLKLVKSHIGKKPRKLRIIKFISLHHLQSGTTFWSYRVVKGKVIPLQARCGPEGG